MNMNEDGAYYMEDRMWSDGKTIEEKAQSAKDYIERYIDIMEENRDRSIEFAKKQEKPQNGYAWRIHKSWITAGNAA